MIVIYNDQYGEYTLPATTGTSQFSSSQSSGCKDNDRTLPQIHSGELGKRWQDGVK